MFAILYSRHLILNGGIAELSTRLKQGIYNIIFLHARFLNQNACIFLYLYLGIIKI